MSAASDRKSQSSRSVRVCGAVLVAGTLAISVNGPSNAASAVSCGGFAMLGGAQINCSHVLPKAPAQFCTFSWALTTTAGALQTVQGSFLVPPGASNATVYQAGGFANPLSNPIILCQGRRSR